MTSILIIVGIAAVVLFWGIAINNGLVAGKNAVKAAWADIDAELVRRLDLIPNLVSAVKGYMKHESETLNAVIAARNNAFNARANGLPMGEQVAAAAAFSTQTHTLMGLVEAYPDLKANGSVGDLMEELTHTENMLKNARTRYNDAVNDQNNRVQMFPSSIIAGMRHFTPEDLFKVEEAERTKALTAPKVEL